MAILPGGTGGLRIDELYYEMSLRSENMLKGFSDIEAAGAKFATFMQEHPIAVAAAVGAVITAMAVKLVENAAMMEKALMQLGNTVPGFTGDVDTLRGSLEQLAIASGTSTDTLIAGAKAIASQGTKGMDDLMLRLKTVNEIAVATGGDIGEIGSSMSRVAREFDISGDAFKKMGDQLFALSLGKVAITDLTDAVVMAAPAVLKYGLDLETTTGAIGFLVQHGEKARQAGAAVRQLAAEGDHGIQMLKDMSEQAYKNAQAMSSLSVAYNRVEETSAQAGARLKAEFMSRLDEIGHLLLPIANLGLTAMAALLDRIANAMSGGKLDLAKFKEGLGQLDVPKDVKLLPDYIARMKTEIAGLESQRATAMKTVATEGNRPIGTAGIGGGSARQEVAAAKQAMDDLQAEIEQRDTAIAKAQANLAAGVPAPLSSDLQHWQTLIDTLDSVGKKGTAAKDALKGVSVAELETASHNAMMAGQVALSMALDTLIAKVRAGADASAAAAEKAKAQLSTLDEAAQGMVNSIQDQAVTATAQLEGPFSQALARLDASLEAKRVQLQKKLDEAAKEAAKVGPTAIAAQAKTGAADLSAFDTAKQAIIDGTTLKHQRDVELNDTKSLAASDKDYRVAKLELEGKSAEAQQLSVDLATQEAVQNVWNEVALGKMDFWYGVIIAKQMIDTAEMKKQTEERAKEVAARKEITAAQDDLAASTLDSEGKIRDAQALRLQLAEKAYEMQVDTNLAAGVYGTGQQAIDTAHQLKSIAQQKLDLDLKQVGKDRLADATALHSAVLQTASAGVDLLSSLGMIDAPLSNGLKSALGLADALQKAGTAFKGTSLLDQLSSITSVIGAATAVAGAIGSMFSTGPSPEEQAQIARNQSLTDAIVRLTDAFNSYKDVTIRGSAYSALSGLNVPSFTNSVFNASRDIGLLPGGSGAQADVGVMAVRELKKLGITMDDVTKAAHDLGYPLAATGPTLEDITNIAIGLQALHFDGFAKNFASQLDELNLSFRVYNTTGASQFTPLVDFLTNPTTGAPAVFLALKGIDVTTAEGAAKATKILQQMFENFRAGKLTGDDLGGLNPTQFIDMITALLGLVPAAGAATTAIDGLTPALIKMSAADQLAAKLTLLGQSFQIFNTSNVDKVRQTIAALSGANTSVGNVLGGLDPSTPAGRDAIRAGIQALFQSIKDGADLGVVGIQDLINLLGLLNSDASDAAAAAAADAAAAAAKVKLVTDQTNAQTDAELRLAKARGDQPEIDRLIAIAEKEKEAADYAAALAAGFDTVTAAMIAGADAAEYTAAQLATKQAAADKANQDAATAQQAAEQAQQQAATDAATAAAAAQAALFKTGTDGLARLQNQFGLFNITDPVQKLSSLVTVLKAGAPVFQQVLGNIDVGTAQGRTDALKSLQAFFMANPQGTASGLFDASTVLSQTLAAAQAIKDAQTGAGDITGTGTSTSFTISRNITEITGERMAGLLGSVVTLLSDIRGILSTAFNVPSPSLIAPSVGTGTAGASSATYFQFYFNDSALPTSTILSPATMQAAVNLSAAIALDIALKGKGG